MATRYVWSGAAGTAAGTSFTDAHLTMAAAITAGTAGDTYLVASDHAEMTSGALSLTFKGTATAPDYIVSVDRTTGVGTPGAKISVSGAGGLTITGPVSGMALIDGVYLNAAGTDPSVSNAANLSISPTSFGQIVLRNSFVVTNINNSSRVQIGGSNSRVIFDNVSVFTAAAGSAQALYANVPFEWRNSTPYVTSAIGFTGGGIPPVLFDTSTAVQVPLTNCDLTAFSGKTFFTSGGPIKRFLLAACKMPALASLPITNFTQRGDLVELVACSDASATDRNERHAINGVASIERTIGRTGGASDGTNNVTFKLATNTVGSKVDPVISFETAVSFTSADIGVAKTLTLHCVTDNVTLNNDQLWVEASYLAGSSAQGTMVSSAPASVATAATALTSDSGTAWTTTGLTTPVKQKLSVTFTPQRAGDARFVLKLGKASTVVYVDPKADVV